MDWWKVMDFICILNMDFIIGLDMVDEGKNLTKIFRLLILGIGWCYWLI